MTTPADARSYGYLTPYSESMRALRHDKSGTSSPAVPSATVPRPADSDRHPLDAHPCEGPGSDPQDFLPDDRAWGSRPPRDSAT